MPYGMLHKYRTPDGDRKKTVMKQVSAIRAAAMAATQDAESLRKSAKDYESRAKDLDKLAKSKTEQADKMQASVEEPVEESKPAKAPPKTEKGKKGEKAK